MNFECNHCGIPFIRPYRMNVTRKSRSQFCSSACAGKHASNKAAQRFGARLNSRIDKASPDSCWPWTGRLDPRGYGRIDKNGKPRLAHREVFFLANPGADPSLTVCHSCDNPPCCNPNHLWGGTHKENMEDMAAKGRTNPPSFLGEKHPGAKLGPADILAIRASSERPSSLAVKFGVTAENISRIRSRLTWKHI